MSSPTNHEGGSSLRFDIFLAFLALTRHPPYQPPSGSSKNNDLRHDLSI